jgi:hypothetical protein
MDSPSKPDGPAAVLTRVTIAALARTSRVGRKIFQNVTGQ